MPDTDHGLTAGSSREWNWHPDLPVAVSPLFAWPPRPVPTLRWFAGNWLPMTEFMIYALMALATVAYLLPDLSAMAEPGVAWITQIWLRNLMLMIAFAGGLHLWLYRWKRQSEQVKYDKRGMTSGHPSFLFGDQVHDNMFHTLVSGITVWSAFEAMVWLALANGWGHLITFGSNPVWFVLLFLLIPVIQAFHFYVVHRALHWPPLYKPFHSLHHRNVSVGPWSGLSMHPVEHLMYLSTLFVFLVVPCHPAHVIFMGFWLGLATATSHSGYEAVLFGTSARLKIGSFFHQLHHRYFECNYGNPEFPLDVWFGSYHDGSPEATKRIRKRQSGRGT